MTDLPPDPRDLVRRRRPLRKIILARTSALPALVTLLNGICGFASIHYATKNGLFPSAALSDSSFLNLTIAAWLIFAAMAFDALDGRLARMTRQTTDFGAQLDSLCDAISFGVAPAVLMLHTVAMTRQIDDFDILLPQASVLGKVVMVIAVIYVACAVLRLARFNIENAPDLLHHLSFKGLPSPAAAAAVAATVLLFDHLQLVKYGWESAPWVAVSVGVALPALTLAVALLMVSRFRYPHLLNQLVIGKKPFLYIVRATVVIAAGIVFRELALALVTVFYAASGPVGAIYRKLRPHVQPQAPSPTA